MALNRPVQSEGPVSSSEEEEEEEEVEEEEVGSSEENSESESEAEEQGDDKTLSFTSPVTKKPSSSKKSETHQTSVAKEAAAASDEDDSGSESDSESDSPLVISNKSDPNVKPITSKPMDDLPKSTKKPRSKPSIPTSPSPEKSRAGAKRPAESEPKDSKRAKKISLLEEEENGAKKANTDDQKKQLFQRLWSEEDEIVILKGIIDYVAKKGADPVNDMNAFHDFIKKSLHIDVTKTQLQDKVRRLKKKYANNASKEKKGKDRTFSKAHEQKAYDLSKKIWGSDGKIMGVDRSKVNGSSKKNSNQRAGKSPRVNGLSSPEVDTVEVEHNVVSELQGSNRIIQFGMCYGNNDLEKEIVNNGLELIEGPRRVELEEKWNKLRQENVELFLKRVELIHEQTKVVLEAIKSQDN